MFFLILNLMITMILGQELADVYVQNLDANCLYCLCQAATGCDLTLGCQDGYCGPYRISKVYWIDAEKIVMPDDDPNRPGGAFEDCATSYHCSQRIVKSYMAKFGKDCNKDGVTNCDDYSMINFNGGYQCHHNLERNEPGRNWTSRYRRCAPIN